MGTRALAPIAASQNDLLLLHWCMSSHPMGNPAHVPIAAAEDDLQLLLHCMS
jgi:hypothetical protein